ncbi:uncharacterized protein K02A2.6-like [Ornithodoros turicata]|uniref:uncharacterized protein K02A2.6-like n=1 Tax=Ornithodoros turicata TaxID=34597 RepID=UPI003139E52E
MVDVKYNGNQRSLPLHILREPGVPLLGRDWVRELCLDWTQLNAMSPDIKSTTEQLFKKLDEIFAALAGGKHFSKIDLNWAYLQVEVDEQSPEYLTLNTHKGLYKVNRLAFGITSAPAMFQNIMENMLKDLSGVIVYLDDILIMGRSQEEHVRNLEAVLKHLAERGVKIKKEKCEFFKNQFQYLGHVINAEGIKPSLEKVEAILHAPPPADKQQLRSLLGAMNFYGKFLPDLSSVLYPLHRLLRLKVAWNWNQQCQQAFKKVKELLSSPPLLVHYDMDIPLQLECDASAYGVGAVLSHIQADGSAKPIAYASKTLSVAESNYSHLEREALGVIFGVKKFHNYLYGRHFVLFTDHKPLKTIFGVKTGIPSIAAARLQRWALTLAAYQYELRYRSGSTNGVADYFSRLPLKQKHPESADDGVCALYTVRLQSFPVSSTEIAKETARDPILSVVGNFIRNGWPPSNCDEALKPYFLHRTALTVHQGCISWGMRILVPAELRSRVLEELHSGHPGIVRMKEIARGYTWWPGIDFDLERMVKECDDCQDQRPLPAKAPLHPWSWPSEPWERVHLDYAGPFQNKNFFVAVDAHSKWPEVFVLGSTSAEMTVQCVLELFARWGIATTIVTDNGPQFCSESFQVFLKQNGVRYVTSAPYHPSTNGLAERFLRTLKECLRKDRSQSLEVRLANLLLSYRNPPHATTSQSPASLMLGRTLKTRLDLIRPSLKSVVTQKQQTQILKRNHQERVFQVGDSVRVRNYRSGTKWVHGFIISRTGPVSYKVKVITQHGTFVWRRHIDQIVAAQARTESSTDLHEQESSDLMPAISTGPCSETPVTEKPPTPVQARRYPLRERRPPQRYEST